MKKSNNVLFFLLKKHCFVELGSDGAAIYDLLNKQLYEIDLLIGKIIKKCDNEKTSLISLLSRYASSKKNKIMNYLAEIENLGLGDFYNKLVVIEKIQYSISKDSLHKMKQPPIFKKLWLNIENRCNLKCLHCNENNNTIARCGCNVQSDLKEEKYISTTRWYSIIDDAALFKCIELSIIGGEPLIKKDKLLSIIQYAKTKGIPNISVNSNGILLNRNIINVFKINKVTWNTTIYSYKKNIHDSITGKKGSWEILIDKIKLAKLYDLQISVKIEVMKINQGDLQETINFIKKFGIKEIVYDFVLSKNRKIWPNEYESMIFKTKQNIINVSKDEFFRNKEGNSCWNGMLAVLFNGNIVPCIMAKKEIIGNIKNISIRDVIKKGLMEKYWYLSKDKIENCKFCEFRYACFDCRPKENAKGYLFGPNKFCIINK